MTQAPNQTAQSAVIGANTPAASANLSFTNSMSSFTAAASVTQQTIEATPTQQQQHVTTVVATAVAVNTQQSTNPQSGGSMSKSAYDSLAPLNLPSKPIYYGQENSLVLPSLALSNLEATTNSSNSNDSAKSEDSRLDEKAKLESILLTSMNSQCQMPGGSMSNNSQYSTNNKLIHNTQADATLAAGAQQMTAQAILQQQQFQQQTGNRFTANQWPPRMPMRPLPATYRCGICKKPGHPKNMCPDAVNNICFYLVLNALTLNLFVLLSINFQFKIIIIILMIQINVLINKSNNNNNNNKNGCFKIFLRTKHGFLLRLVLISLS